MTRIIGHALTFMSLVHLLHCHLGDRAKAKDAVEFHDDLQYTEHNAGQLDLYIPRQSTSPTPAVIFIHGGYWRNQSRNYYRLFTGLYQNFGLALAKRGIATAVIDYRLHPKATLREQLSDVGAAAGFIKANAAKYKIDASQIYLAGHSAGGHLALMESWSQKSTVSQGAIALSPILDIAHMRSAKDKDFNESLTVPFFGNGEHDMQHSPVSYATAGALPALLLFGEKDDEYLLQQRDKYDQQFSQKKLMQVEVKTIKDADHTTMVMHVNTDNDNISDVIAAFVHRQQKGSTHAR